MSEQSGLGINVKNKLISGTGWRGGAEVFRIGWSSLVVLILATMLSPSDFGLVGMIDVFVQFFNLLTTMGFESAIVQQKVITDEILSSLFWINIAFGVALSGIGMVLAPTLGWFYQEPLVVPIFMVLSLSFLLQSLSAVQRGLLERRLAFSRLASIDVIAIFLSSLLALMTAFSGGSYWSLVVLQLGRYFFTTVGYWVSSDWRPRRQIDIRAAMDCFRFSANLLLFNVLNFTATRADIVLIGRLLGSEQLGFYLLAHRLVVYPIGQVLIIIGRTVYPILARFQEDRARIRHIYMKLIYGLLALFAPLVLAVSIVAPLLLPMLLGPEWVAVVPIFWVWGAGSIRRILTSTLGVIYLSMGRPDLQWKYQAISTPFVLVCLVLGASGGALGIAISYNLGRLLVSFVSVYLAFGLIDLKMRKYFKQFLPIFMALLIEFCVGFGLYQWLQAENAYLLFAAVIFVSIAIYGVVLYLVDARLRDLWQDGYRWLMQYQRVSRLLVK